jgi:hypothetical protein
MAKRDLSALGMDAVMRLIIEETFKNTIAYIQEKSLINVNMKAVVIGLL